MIIREARARSNAAIAKHDLAGIASVWLEDVHVTSSTSARGDGRAANQERMGQPLIQSELYVPTACKGSSYCSKRP
jgi:ketosteroid isomerase-like protein